MRFRTWNTHRAKKVWSPTDNLNEKEKENSVRELPIVKLDRQKRGRPTILGAFVDELVCQYVTCFALFQTVVRGTPNFFCAVLIPCSEALFHIAVQDLVLYSYKSPAYKVLYVPELGRLLCLLLVKHHGELRLLV